MVLNLKFGKRDNVQFWGKTYNKFPLEISDKCKFRTFHKITSVVFRSVMIMKDNERPRRGCRSIWEKGEVTIKFSMMIKED